MNSAAAILGEANRLAPEPSAYLIGAEGAPSRFAGILMDLLSRAEGEWECRLLKLEQPSNPDRTPIYRGVFRFVSGEFLAFTDNEAVIAISEQNVVRDSSGKFGGVWDGRDLNSLADVVFRMSDNEPLAAAGPSQAQAAVDRALAWGQQASGMLSIPEDEILGEIEANREEYLRILNGYNQAEELQMEEIEKRFLGP